MVTLPRDSLLPPSLARRRPHSGAEVENLVRDAIAFAAAPKTAVDQLESEIAEVPPLSKAMSKLVRSVQVAARLDGDNITSLDLRASDITIPFSEEYSEPEPPGEATVDLPNAVVTPAVATEISGTLSNATFRKARFSVFARATDVAFSWVEDGGALVAVDTAKTWSGVGTAKAEGDLQAICNDIRYVVNQQSPVQFTSLKIRGESIDGRTAKVSVKAGIRRSILRASAKGSAQLHVDDQFRLHVSDLVLGSLNPLVAITLRVFRKRIREAIAEPISLSDELPDEIELTHLDVRFDRNLTIDVAVRGTGLPSAATA